MVSAVRKVPESTKSKDMTAFKSGSGYTLKKARKS